jgi:hypothetical protein
MGQMGRPGILARLEGLFGLDQVFLRSVQDVLVLGVGSQPEIAKKPGGQLDGFFTQGDRNLSPGSWTPLVAVLMPKCLLSKNPQRAGPGFVPGMQGIPCLLGNLP